MKTIKIGHSNAGRVKTIELEPTVFMMPCPKCRTLAEDYDKVMTTLNFPGKNELWFQCPECNYEFKAEVEIKQPEYSIEVPDELETKEPTGW